MGDVNYRPVIDDMVWSYSRIRTFHSCPYQWYLKYLCDEPDEELFFSSYGAFVHSILDDYYAGRITKSEAELRYLSDFSDSVAAGCPSDSIFNRYFSDGLRYMEAPPPLPLENIQTERTMFFDVDGYPFTARLDVDGFEPGGDLCILDHKSRLLKPRSGRKKPTVSDVELDDYLRQLYLYSIPVIQGRGTPPAALYFNCFRGLRDRAGQPTGAYFIREKFDPEAFCEAKMWAVNSIRTIRETEDFRPDLDYFKCRYLCGVHESCEYYQMNFSKRRRGF